VNLPKPSKGNYSRGDVLQGFTGVSTAEHFRVMGAGNVWRWNDIDGWTIEPMPSVEKRLSGVIGFGSVGNRNVHVVHNGLCLPGQPKSLPPCDYLAYWREGDRWREPIRVPVAGVSQVISTSAGVFLRSSYGELFRLDPAAATRMEVPSTCEAIARTSDGKLLASFKGAGVFELDRDWIKRMEYPYSESEGEHRAYLSESHGTIALATSSVQHLVTKRGNEYRPTFTGTDALWISEDQKPRRVHLRGQ
jgi:hypothetical protein